MTKFLSPAWTSLLSSRPPQRLPVSSQTKAFKTTQEGLHDLPITHASVTSPASTNAARNALPPNIHMAHSRYLQVSAQMSPPLRGLPGLPGWRGHPHFLLIFFPHSMDPTGFLSVLFTTISPVPRTVPGTTMCPVIAY